MIINYSKKEITNIENYLIGSIFIIGGFDDYLSGSILINNLGGVGDN